MVAAVTATAGGVAVAGDARDLVKQVFDAIPQAPFAAKATLTSDRGWVRELDFSHKHLGDIDAAYLEVTAPMDLKDTRFLLLDHVVGRDEQFMYVPAMKRTVQVSGETRKQPFLGSDFFIYDMVRPEFDAYTYSFVGEEEVGGRHCQLVQSVPKVPANELYGKTVTAIDPSDAVVLRTQFFDKQDKLLKVWTIEKLEKIEGNWTPLVQQMANVQDHHQSRLEVVEIHYNTQLPDQMFQRSYLSR
jgi:outer membrane lipoprotein-sorting protein